MPVTFKVDDIAPLPVFIVAVVGVSYGGGVEIASTVNVRSHTSNAAMMRLYRISTANWQMAKEIAEKNFRAEYPQYTIIEACTLTARGDSVFTSLGQQDLSGTAYGGANG